MKNDELEITNIEVQSVGVTEAQSRAEIDIQITTAKRYPRSAQRAVDNVIAVISKDHELAASCVYAVPRAGKEIKGASVHLARFLATEYKNLRIDARIVDIGDQMITGQAICLDLENNVATRTEVKRRITDKQGQRYSEDMIVTTCNAALAIASRNAILQTIPAPYVNQCYRAAQKALIGTMDDQQKLIKRRKEILDGFLNTYNVTEAEILSFLNLETINQIKEDQMISLIGLGQAIKDGDISVAEAFGRTPQNNVAKESKEKVDAAIKKAKERKAATANPPNVVPGTGFVSDSTLETPKQGNLL